MEIRLALTLSPDVLQYAKLFNSVQVHLISFFESKNYDGDINAIYIGVVCVSPQFKNFGKIKKPKFGLMSSIRTNEDISKRFFEYEILIDYAKLKDANSEQALKLLTDELLNSMEIFNKLKDKLNGFNISEFNKDIGYFINECHIR